MHLERKLVVTSFVLLGILFVSGYIAGLRTDSPVSTEVLTLGSREVRVEVMSDEESRARGLSGRPSLAEGAGMLFAFDSSDLWGIWMKDMRFSIDIIWLDSTGTIVSVEKNVSPDTYPKIFFPTKRSRYVLEVPAGVFEVSGARIGGSVVLPESLRTKK